MGDRGGVVMFSLAYFPDTLLPYQANRITPLLSDEGGEKGGVEGEKGEWRGRRGGGEGEGEKGEWRGGLFV